MAARAAGDCGRVSSLVGHVIQDWPVACREKGVLAHIRTSHVRDGRGISGSCKVASGCPGFKRAGGLAQPPALVLAPFPARGELR